MRIIRDACCIASIGLLWSAAHLSAWGQAANQPAVPEITVSTCKQPPIIDGQLTDECWKKAAVIDRLVLYGDPQSGTSDLTKISVTYDDTWLYLAFDCRHPYPDRIVPLILDHDGPVNRDESVEVFLDPGTNGKLYFHYLLNAANVRAEQRVTSASGSDRAWNVPWRSATLVTAKGWQAEVAIPLYVLAAHGDLATLRMNLVRNAQIPIIDEQKIQVGTKQASGTWGAVVRSYHEPDRFGRVKGISAAVKTPLLAGLDEATVGRYAITEGKYAYSVDTGVMEFTPQAGTVTVEVLDEPVSGKASAHSQAVPLPGMGGRPVKITVPVETPVARSVRVRLLDPATGEVLAERRAKDTSALNLMSAYLDRTYYTDETQAVVVCSFGLPADDLKDTVLRVRGGADRAVLGEVMQVTPETQAPFRVKTLFAKTQSITVELARKTGAVLYTQEMELIKRPPKPGSEVKVDRINLFVIKDGQPVFPFGYVMYGVSADCERFFQEVADAGFNAVMHWAFMTPEDGKRYQDVCAKYGLLVVNDITRYGGRINEVKGRMVGAQNMSKTEKSRIFAEEYEKMLPANLKGIELVKDSTNLLAYYSFDEPFGPEFFDMYLQGQDLYRRANEIDGYHPSLVWYSEKEIVGWADITGVDPYWVPMGTGERGTPNYVSHMTTLFRKCGEKYRLPVWMVPMGESWSGCDKRALLPEEQYCQTYLAVIHGAKGLFYFKYRPFHLASFEALKRLAGEMKVIGPIAVTPDVPQKVAYSPGTLDPEKGQFPDVQVALRRGPDGRYVLLAANSRYFPVDAVFTAPGLGNAGKVSRHFGAEEYPIGKDGFAERLPPLATRAYILPAGTKLAEPVQIAVAMTARPELSKPEAPALPITGRPGKKNLVRNPGFEEATLPLWPDYYKPDADFGKDYTGTPGATWTQDMVQPYEGKACLRMKDKFGFNFKLSPQNLEAKPYVFSVYLRAEKEGMKVQLFGPDSREVALTKDWQRYSCPVVVPARASPYMAFGVQPLDGGVLWADAVQVEPGKEPTEYEP